MFDKTGSDFLLDEEDIAVLEESVPYVSLNKVLKTLPNEAKELAIKYMTAFFDGKQMHYGGPITKNDLFSSSYINLVLESRFENGIEIVYSMLGSDFILEDVVEEVEDDDDLEAEDLDDMSDKHDIKKVLSMIKEMQSKLIPVEFQVGIMIIYLELCEGITRPTLTSF